MIYRGVVTLPFTARFDEVSFPTAPNGAIIFVEASRQPALQRF